MNTYRTHAQLSAAIRSHALARAQLKSGHLSSIGRLVLRCRTFYADLRIRELVARLHAR